MKTIRVILNGKGAGNPQVRAAINQIRDEGQSLEVRCTWEGGDAARFAQEAMGDGIDVLVAGGGGGTINEVVNGVLAADTSPPMALGILPLGTANDFARDHDPADDAQGPRRLALEAQQEGWIPGLVARFRSPRGPRSQGLADAGEMARRDASDLSDCLRGRGFPSAHQAKAGQGEGKITNGS